MAAVLTLGASGSGFAQGAPAAECFPKCRAGFLCQKGQCVSACNPACGPGTLCSPQGKCVSACNPPCQPGTLCSPQGECVSACNPACGPGTLCSPQGECVSACNPPCQPGTLCSAQGECVAGCDPPCAAGATCTAAGRCEPATPAPSPPPAGPTQSAVPVQPVAPAGQAPGVGPLAALGGPAASDPGWARTAGYLGIATSVVVGGLTVATVASDDDEDVALPLGIVATVIGGIMIPVVAMGGASARSDPAVEGLPSLRTTSWVGYAAALVDAAVLIGLSLADAAAPAAVTGSVGVLGVASCTGMTLDAFESASQAEALGGPQPATQRLALTPFATPVGRVHQGMVVGVRGAL